MRAVQGTPYVWGGEELGGFDCSGLIQWLRIQLGKPGGPRTASAQLEKFSQNYRRGVVGRWGDLVFRVDGVTGRATHVAVCLGAALGGKRQVIDASQRGTTVHAREVEVRETDAVVPREVAWN